MSIKFYKCGGAIRDELLNIPCHDLDYCVVAPSFDAMRAAIIERGGTIYLETPQHYTIKAKVPGLGTCDYVLARREGPYLDGRHPSYVEIGTLEDDLRRRSFTVNAMARDEEGNLIDLFNGQQHLEQRLLVCVGETRERLKEDKLRCVRAIRFCITKKFRLSDEICDCLHDDLIVDSLKGVSVERIREEAFKMFECDTRKTWLVLNQFPLLRDAILDAGIWLKPTIQ